MGRLTRQADGHATVLVVDDDQRMRRLLRLNLEKAGYRVSTVEDGATGLEQAELEPPDLIVLDVMMPEMDGFTFLRRLREFSDVPVIMLSAKGEEQDKVHGLDLGADDYLTKPFAPAEMLARVRAALRRGHPEEQPVKDIQIGDLTINLARRRIIRGDQEIRLTPTEYKLLYELATHPGRVLRGSVVSWFLTDSHEHRATARAFLPSQTQPRPRSDRGNSHMNRLEEGQDGSALDMTDFLVLALVAGVALVGSRVLELNAVQTIVAVLSMVALKWLSMAVLRR